MAIGVLVATDRIDTEAIEGLAFLGELGLDGSIRPVRGALPMADAVGDRTVVVAPENAGEATLLGRQVRPVATLGRLVECLLGAEPWPAGPRLRRGAPTSDGVDLRDVRGQQIGKLALPIAAAGGHHLLMVGPPGAGKTMLAKRLPGLLPELDMAAALEVCRVHSAACLLYTSDAADE